MVGKTMGYTRCELELSDLFAGYYAGSWGIERRLVYPAVRWRIRNPLFFVAKPLKSVPFVLMMCFGLAAKDGHANALAAASDQQTISVLRNICLLVGRGGAARRIRSSGIPGTIMSNS